MNSNPAYDHVINRYIITILERVVRALINFSSSLCMLGFLVVVYNVIYLNINHRKKP